MGMVIAVTRLIPGRCDGLQSFIGAYVLPVMTQGSWLGPLSFIILIDDLAAGPILHKYVDDTTISEPLSSTSQTSDIQSHYGRPM